MDELQALQHQLEEARDEAELNLLQLQQVQEELEFYFLRCQELESAQNGQPAEEAPPSSSQDGLVDSGNDPDAAEQACKQAETERDQALAEASKLRLACDSLTDERNAVIQQAEQNATLLRTAQRMLEGQARYLEDVSSREEQAAQALDRIRLLEAEILYYIQHSKPLASLDPARINRLIQLAKQVDSSQRPVGRR
jgi:hypothetical protein